MTNSYSTVSVMNDKFIAQYSFSFNLKTNKFPYQCIFVCHAVTVSLVTSRSGQDILKLPLTAVSHHTDIGLSDLSEEEICLRIYLCTGSLSPK